MSQNESSASVPTGNVILPTAYMSSPPPNTGQVYHIMTNANCQNFATSTPVSGQYITSQNNAQNNNTILEEMSFYLTYNMLCIPVFFFLHLDRF